MVILEITLCHTFLKKSEKYGFSGKTGRVGEFGDDGATGKIYINGKEKKPDH